MQSPKKMIQINKKRMAPTRLGPEVRPAEEVLPATSSPTAPPTARCSRI